MNLSWRRLFAVLITLAIGGALPCAVFGEWDFSGVVFGEVRTFPEKPRFANQTNTTFSPSLVIQPELVYEWNDRRDRVTIEPFLRVDAHDDNRTHADLREASWLHQADDWDLVVGISTVFWGVTESRHLVDIINQTDRVEDIDMEDKLGQPMVNLNLIQDWGTVSLFVLPGFRERTFPDDDARLRGPLPIEVAHPSFESDAEALHVDYAARWAHTVDEWDIGVAHFYGTTRQPFFRRSTRPSGQMVFIPLYDLIHQTSLDLQYTTDAWLWKLETIVRSGHGDPFFASVAGFEYTFFQIFESTADLGVLAEYQYDGRDLGTAPFTLNDDDFFIGARLTLNDEQDTALLAGTTIDRDVGSVLLFIEAERRLSDHWKLEVESRLFPHVPDDDFAAGFRNDGFITTRLSYFF